MNIDLNLLLGFGGCAFVAVMAFFLFKALRDVRNEHEEAVEEMNEMEEEKFRLPEPRLQNARVLRKHFRSDVIGTKSVRQVSSYFVTFFTEDGETVEYAVPEEIFLRIEQGQESTLVTVDGEFLDFGDGEPIEQEE